MRLCMSCASPFSSVSPLSRPSWTGGPVQSASAASTFAPRYAILRHHLKAPAARRIITANIGGGGFLGVGPAELIVVVAVGWFLLGPTKLYALSKETGRVVGELRRAADEARTTFTDAIELELEEEKRKEEMEKASAENKDKSENSSEDEKQKADEEGIKSDTEESESPLDGPLNGPELQPSKSVTDALIGEENEFTSLEKQGPVAGVSPAFLDQIKRVSDPNQVSPSEASDSVPDLDMSVEFEMKEVERLEQEYLEAKARLEEKKSEREFLEAKQKLTDKIEQIDAHSISAEAESAKDQAQNQPDSKSFGL